MRYVSCVSVLALVAAFVMFLSAPSSAEVQMDAGGSISGKVVDGDGNAVEGASVKVLPAPAKPEKAKKEKADKLVEEGDAPKQKKPKPTPVAEGTTAADGTFKLEGIPAGSYAVVAMAKGKGMGKAMVTVADGQSVDSVEIKLVMKPKAPKPE